MTTFYNHQQIEKKWQERWDKDKINFADDKSKKPKRYILDMFPYPSGEGLHVGHVESYTATDIISRYLRMNSYNVLHPQGFDAFGLPAENYAIQTGVHPQKTTQKAIENFKRQLNSVGLSYDWSREVITSDPNYYKWTQWLFLQLFKKGLAYKKKAPVNWCPDCQTVLANEQVKEGRCERCETIVIQKELEQWFFKITDYAEELLSKIDEMDWPEALKHAQKNWIGKSEGALIDFKIQDTRYKIQVFTTRPDTLFGATYLVLAPEHPIIEELGLRIKNWSEVQAYIQKSKSKNQLERTDLNKEKTGVELKGIKVINPANRQESPIWVADYVMMDYGTGAIMAVPGHDERDWEFAKKYGLEIKQVIAPLFVITTGPDAVRKNKPTVKRRTVYCFVKHWQEDKYLCLDWEKYNWHSGIIGGIEDGEDIIEAARREIREETGYKNLKFICQIGGEYHNYFFAGHKDENRYAIGQGLFFELINGEWEELVKQHTKHHKAVWIAAEKMKSFLNLPNFLYMWELYSRGEQCYAGEGVLINSDKFNGLSSGKARDKIIKFVKGRKEVQYKIRDWLISRQRYWGAPIPIIYCRKCWENSKLQAPNPKQIQNSDYQNSQITFIDGLEHIMFPVPEKDLPVKLPNDVDFKPTGESPLARSKSFHSVKCPQCGSPARRESDTMDTFVCSSWYFLRYCDPHNQKEPFSKKSVKYWLPVDLYIGGMEHAVGHLLYARFITKVLRDLDYLKFDEPFLKIRNQGIILAEDSRKMSKRWGNVINPDDVVEEYGADTLRMYEMFMGPLSDAKPWSQKGIIGVRRFLEKIYKCVTSYNSQETSNKQTPNSKLQTPNNDLNKLLHKTIKKVTEDIENLRFNTAISAMMIFVNHVSCIMYHVSNDVIEKFLIILAPFAPHLSEELWESLGHKESIFKEKWPEYDKKLIVDEEITIAIQINGKLRETILVERGIEESDLRTKIEELPKVKQYLQGQTVKKFIYVKDKLVNIVV